jgi:hypothetical protein
MKFTRWVHAEHKKESDNATRASVQKEMRQPRMSKSARIAERKIDIACFLEQPIATVIGTVGIRDVGVSLLELPEKPLETMGISGHADIDR